MYLRLYDKQADLFTSSLKAGSKQSLGLGGLVYYVQDLHDVLVLHKLERQI